MNRRAERADRNRKSKRIALVVWGVVLAAVIVVAILVVPRVIDRLQGPADFDGAGHGEVTVRIAAGDTGSDVANTLVDENVIASSQAFVALLVADSSINLHPGAYRLAEEMSAQAALDALQDPANKLEMRVTIPEGFMLEQVYTRLSEATGIDAAEFRRLGSDFTQFGVPEGAVSIEGWLFPATYTFDDGATAESILQTMVNRMVQALDEHGVPEADRQRIVTLASLIQREARLPEDFPKVSRVFLNRLDIGMLLQSDATVHYGTGDTSVVTTTAEERGDPENPYNTYVHQGLPVGPIGAPGDVAIDAAMNPADGTWLYFVTVNPDTGETVFSNTLAEHEAAAQQFYEWLRNNPSDG